jgi:hypothetical protein
LEEDQGRVEVVERREIQLNEGKTPGLRHRAGNNTCRAYVCIL